MNDGPIPDEVKGGKPVVYGRGILDVACALLAAACLAASITIC